MKVAAVAVAVSGLVSAAAADGFSLLAARSASPIHLRPIDATGTAFYIGKKTTAYCPDSVRQQGGCPNKKGSKPQTVFVGGDKTLAMNTIVPGGQQVYIDPSDGAVGFTVAHSASMPEGAIVTGWNLEENVISGSEGILSWKRGLLACPCDSEEDVYKIYAAVKGVDFSDDCLGFDGIAANTTKSVWEYI